MSFIELTRADGDSSKVTVNTDHILTFYQVDARSEYERSGTKIQMGGGALPAHSFFLVTEPYEEVRRLHMLDWLHCGENFQGDVCDRRLDKEGMCPVHGMVGA